MQVPFPGSPARLRILLARSFYDEIDWVAFERFLVDRFTHVNVTRSIIRSPSNLRKRSVFVSSAISGASAERVALSRCEPAQILFIDYWPELGENICGFQRDYARPDGLFCRLTITFSQDLKERYRSSLAVLLGHIDRDLEDAVHAEGELDADGSYGFARTASILDRAPGAVALLNEKMKLIQSNPEMDCLLHDRALFRPGCAGGLFWIRDQRARARFDRAFDDIQSGRSSRETVVIDGSCRRLSLTLRRVERPCRDAANTAISPLLVTALCSD